MPSILTSQFDNMYGEQIGTGCASIPPGGAPALWVWYSVPGSVGVNGMDIRFAQTGVEFDGSSCGQLRSFNYSTIQFCDTGIYANDCAVTIQDSITSSVGTPSSTTGCGSVSGTWTNTCNQISLESAVVSEMQTLAQTHSPEDGIALYNFGVGGYAISYNTNCWIYGLKGLTSICVSNGWSGSPGGPTNNDVWYQAGSVLITSKHAITVDHLGFGGNTQLRFVGKSGAHYTAVVTNQTTIANLFSGDVKLLTLVRDLPSDVETVRVLPYQTYDKLTLDITNAFRDGCLSKYLPGIAVNQGKGAYAEDVYWWATSTYPQTGVAASVWFPAWQNGYEPWGGDSGHPILTVIGNELVLVGSWSQEGWDHTPVLPQLGPSVSNAYDIWVGFAIDTRTNTIVAQYVSRWSIAISNSTHALDFISASGSILSSTPVTTSENGFWVSSPLNAYSAYPYNGWLTLFANNNYYLLSQETAGGDYWHGWPETLNYETNYFTIPGAAASPDLTSFVTYTDGASPDGSTFVPLDFTYFVYPHWGTTSMPGAWTQAINECLSTNGGPQYKMAIFDLSAFPSNLR
jgi:hypothetical protein